MYEVSNRKCFGGRYKLPITQFNRHRWWPPQWIECDCGDYAENVHFRRNGLPYATDRWRCSKCQREYQNPKYTSDFILLEDDPGKPSE